jgi:AraC family transcriptional regulator
MNEAVVIQGASPWVGVRSWHNRGGPLRGESAHATIEIAWTETPDAVVYDIGSRRLALQPQETIVIPAGVQHSTRVASGTKAKVIALDRAALDQMADAMSMHLELPVLVAKAPSKLRVLSGLLFDDVTSRNEGRDMAVESLTGALVVELLRSASSVEPRGPSGPRVPDARIRRAIDLIETSYADPLSLEAISKAAGMSRFHFARVFEAQTGRSPHRYLVDVRVSRAAALLRTGRVAVTEAAFRVGYNDLGRFARAFRARQGISPSQMAEASRSRRAPVRARVAGRIARNAERHSEARGSTAVDARDPSMLPPGDLPVTARLHE